MMLQELSNKVIEDFVNLTPKDSEKDTDCVHAYACELMTLGLLWRNF